jgi:hypothetical protein
MLLARKGVHCTAIDNGSEYHSADWFPVERADGLSYLKQHDGCADSALFFCWPRKNMDVMGMIHAFQGTLLFFIGDPQSCFELTSLSPSFATQWVNTRNYT